jgi:predicted RNase H-like HicB family nuclease
MMDRYVIVLEGDAATNFSAYVPDLPGCVATGATIEETVRLIREAIALHLAAMRRDGDLIPTPTTRLGDPAMELTEDAIGVVEVTPAVALAA